LEISLGLSRQPTFGRVLELDLGSATFIRDTLTALRSWCARRVVENDIGREVRIALRAYIDLTNPHGVHVGDGTLIESGAAVLAHDPSCHFHTDTYVGRNCFIGTRAIIMPGVRIGDQSIILAGSLVKTDVPPGSMVAGDPARVVRSEIRTGKYGILLDDGVDVSAEGALGSPG
jgi:acetyltransferase-like isoleucine patch superfamily enzyme